MIDLHFVGNIIFSYIVAVLSINGFEGVIELLLCITFNNVLLFYIESFISKELTKHVF